MTNTILKATRGFALVAAAGFLMGTTALTPAYAADLGGDCCADLEERVAELEATTVTKGNRKVSVKLYGMVSRAVMIWDDGKDDDIYSVGNSASPSRFGITGSAKIGSGWSAGFVLEWQTQDTWAKNVNQNNDDGVDGEGLSLRHDVLYLKNVRLGTIYMGHSSTSTDGIAEIDLSGAKVISSSDTMDWNKNFGANGAGTATWGNYQDNLDGVRGDAAIRYDTPTYRGFTASGTFGEDDFHDVAVRYAGEFNGVMKIAAGIGYQHANNKEAEDATGVANLGFDTIVGSISALHVPTGINVTFAAGQRDYANYNSTADAEYWYVKGGLLRRFNRLGKTAFYGEYGSYDGVFGAGAGLDAQGSTVWGIGAVQHIDAAAMEVFAAYRHYELKDTADAELDAVMVGARIKF